MRTLAAPFELTVICNDVAEGGLLTEHGLSVWIDLPERPVLFDTGLGETIEANSRKLGINVAGAGELILSHGHYDHTGGLAWALGQNAHCLVLAHAGVAQTGRFSCYPGKPPKPNGMPEASRRALESLPASRKIFIDAPRSLAPWMGLSGSIPRENDFEDTGGAFYLDEAQTRPDTIPDDMALWIQTPAGLFILTGCCHSGLVNMVEHIRRVTGERRVAGIMGGLHLKNASEERLARTVDFLRAAAPGFLILGHCTGEGPAARLGEELPATRLEALRAGRRYRIGADGTLSGVDFAGK